jgi:hypothetical protein
LYVRRKRTAIILLKTLSTTILNSITCTPGVQRKMKKLNKIWPVSKGSPENLAHIQPHNVVSLASVHSNKVSENNNGIR